LLHLTRRLRSQHLAERISAARSLQRLGPMGALPLSEMLDHADDDVSVLVLRALGEMGVDAVSALPAIGRRQTADSPRVALQARVAAFLIDTDSRQAERELLLAEIQRSEPAAAVDAMLQIFAGAPDSRAIIVRQLLALFGRDDARRHLLAELAAGPAKLLPLLEHALDDPDASVRSQVLDLVLAYRDESEGLGWSGDGYRQIFAGVLRRASEDPDPRIRDRARRLRQTAPSGGSGAGGVGGMGGMF
jgi:hypothetical protein